MKLWGGRFTKETDKLVNNFNASISFDQKFYKQDIQGSIAHAKMLGAAGIISEEESTKMVCNSNRLCFLKMGESRHVSVYIFFDDS